MRLGLLTSVFGDRSAPEAFELISSMGISTVEIGVGGYPGSPHCDVAAALESPAELTRFTDLLDRHGLQISALACHGNPLHPDAGRAALDQQVFDDAVRLAEKLDVERLTLFSGCPGDGEAAVHPNWVTCAWPTDFVDLLEWQWSERVIPYWQRADAFAAAHGVHKLCFEMHPGFVVYNPPSLLRLRDAVGPSIGANLDPSHLMWQGIDVDAAIEVLAAAGALFHVHAKDTAINPRLAAVGGVLDTVPLSDITRRTWQFRSVGYGHDLLWWKQFVSTLRLNGYDDVLSIEHEDALAGTVEGVSKAADFLRQCIFTEPMPTPWWTT